MYIDETELRNSLKEVLRSKTRNSIVQDIKSRTGKFHQYQIDKVLQGKDVTLSTAIKLDEFLLRERM
jgi:hypothetical protein